MPLSAPATHGRKARAGVDRAKHALGERSAGRTDGAPDYGCRLMNNTPYAEWNSAVTALFGVTWPGENEARAAKTDLRPLWGSTLCKAVCSETAKTALREGRRAGACRRILWRSH